MQPILTMALRAARGAAQQLVRIQERLDLALLEHHGVANLIQEAGTQLEKSISYTLRKAYHDDDITGLYIGHKAPKARSSGVHWYLNPLVGIDNFNRGLPHVAVAIICKIKDRVEHCVVINPFSGDEFSASRGHGAQLNGKRIRVATSKTLDNALLAYHLPPKAYRDQYLPPFQDIQLALARQVEDLHSTGNPLLSMAAVAAGRLDGMVQLGMDELDMQAGALLIQEAGGLVSDLSGGAHFTRSGNLVCGNPKIFKHLLQTIQPHLTPALKRT